MWHMQKELLHYTSSPRVQSVESYLLDSHSFLQNTTPHSYNDDDDDLMIRISCISPNDGTTNPSCGHTA